MRFLVFAVVLAAISPFAWADASWRLDPGAELRDGNLRVEPKVSGRPGASVRYEIDVRRRGSGSSNSSQSGRARLGENGEATLASTSVSVRPGDRYDVEVRVYDGDRLVAHRTVEHP
jgi:Thin aggregative fimbriae synthesis protein